MRTVTVVLVLLHAALASAVGLGGHSPVPVTRTSAIGEGPGPFDGKTYQLGFYLTPLFGYESNYRVTTVQVAGSGLFAAEAGRRALQMANLSARRGPSSATGRPPR